MARKWLELSPWHSKDPVAAQVSTENRKNGAHASVTTTPAPPPPVKEIREERAQAGPPSEHAELMPMEDIYRAAGITNPRKGYSITKVLEMLQSQHIRDLSTDMKRAAVLMALDAAGVSLEQVREDAKTRQDALDRYEGEQKQLVEAEWARKKEENIQLESDLVRVKAHYTARISRNLEKIALEKSAFDSWLATKKQEAEGMREAVELCSKKAAPQPTSAPLASAAALAAKPLS